MIWLHLIALDWVNLGQICIGLHWIALDRIGLQGITLDRITPPPNVVMFYVFSFEVQGQLECADKGVRSSVGAIRI